MPRSDRGSMKTGNNDIRNAVSPDAHWLDDFFRGPWQEHRFPIVLFLTGALLELLAVLTTLNIGYLNCFDESVSFVAAIIMVVAIYLAFRRIQFLTGLLAIAGGLFALGKFINLTRSIYALVNVPIIGNSSMFSRYIEASAYAVAAFLTIGGTLLITLNLYRRSRELMARHVALEESEQSYATIIRSAMDGFWRIDMEGNIIECNDVYCAISGYSSEELLRMRISDVEALESDEHTLGHIEKVCRAGHDRFETKHRTKDGRILDIEVSATTPINSKGNIMFAFLRDITEQKRAETALRESEQRFRDVALSSADWLWEVDLQGRYVYCSERVYDVLGYTAEELLTKSFFELMTLEEGLRVLNLVMDSVAEPRQILELENRHIHKDGREIVMLTNAVPVLDASGHLCGYRGSDKNITEHVRIQQRTQVRMRMLDYASRHSLEEFLPKALDEIGALVDSPIGFYHFVEKDQKTLTFQAWSTATTEKFCTALGTGAHYNMDTAGVWADSLRQRRPVIHNDYAALPRKKGMPEGHAQVVRELTVPIFRDGLVVAILGVGNKPRDYTEEDIDSVAYLADVTWEIFWHKRADEERLRLAAAIDQAAESVMITDRHGIINYVNPALEKMSGYNTQEVLGKPLSILHNPEHCGTVMETMRGAMERGDTWQGRFKNLHRSAEPYEVEAVISPVRNKAGKVVNYVVLERDISVEAALERQLRQSQKMEAVGTLAGGIAHDFRNILLLVLGHCELALRDLETGHPARQKIRQIANAGTRGTELVKHILAFSRKGEQERQAVNIAARVTEALELFRISLPPHMELRTQIDESCGAVYADPAYIQQVLLNLCNNARQAMLDTGGLLEVSLQRIFNQEMRTADAGALTPGPYVLLSVRDNGCGMDEEIRSRIFEPFFTTRKLEGTGLGLPTIHGIVMDCGGAIIVRSALGKGSVFEVYFPELGEAPPVAVPEADKALPVCSGRLLVLDDDEDVAEMTAGLLQDSGFHVQTCIDSRAALSALLKHEIAVDIIISDYAMPHVTGLQFARILKDNGIPSPVILITGLSEDIGDKEKAESGIVCCLTKPFSTTQLITAIQHTLDAQQR